MRRFSALLLLSLAAIAGCSGGGSNTDKVPASIDLQPATLSLEPGQVVNLTVAVKNSKGSLLNSSTVTYTSSNTSLVQVGTSGQLCVGTWDSLTNPVNCTPATGSGSATITATSGGVTSNTVTIYVHPHIASLQVSAASTACASQTKTVQFTATALDQSNTDITSKVGPITWSTRNATVATVDTNGLVTAVNPGATLISASVSNATSASIVPALPVPVVATPGLNFWTCPPAQIQISTTGSNPAETSYPGLAVAATKSVTAKIIDTAGNTITANLVYVSSLGSSVGFNGSAATGTATASAPGAAGLLAACTPQLCDSGLNFSVYSNLIPATVTGTSASTVYVTGAGATQIVPIDTGTHVAGTPITIPQVNSVQPVVNSMVFNRQGTLMYLGSDQGLIIVDLGSNTVSTTLTGAPGKALTVSPSGSKVIVSDSVSNHIFVVNTAFNNALETYTGSGTAAEFAPDSLKAYVTEGSSLFAYSGNIPSRTLTMAAPATDVAVPQLGSVAFLAGGVSGSAEIRGTCDDADLGAAAGITTTPLFIRSSFDGTRVFAVDAAGVLYDATISASPVVCRSPAFTTGTVSASATAHTLGSFTPKQMVVAADASRVFVTANLAKVFIYAPAGGTATAVTLSSGTAGTTGGATLDGAQFYVGVLGTNDVHRIDPVAGTDVQAIAVNLHKADNTAVSPDFVGVRPK